MPHQRILFGLLNPNLGGHTRTAVALAEVLRDRGYAIDFVVASSGTPSGDSWRVRSTLIRTAGFPILPIAGLYARLAEPSFHQNLRDLVRRHRYDAVHWFEQHAVRDAALVALRERCAFVFTHTSGSLPAGYYGLNSVVVYTREVAEDALRRSPRTVVHVLPGRFDFRPLDSHFIQNARRDIRARFTVTDEDLLIVRVARCTHTYLRSVRAGIALANSLNRAGRPAVFLHAGYAENQQVALEIRRVVDQVNAAAGRPIAYSVTQDVEMGTRFLAAADICIGSGRSAIEALALARPTLVAWGSRYLGMVDAKNIHAISETNFQGRDSQPVVSDNDVVGRMHEAVCRRLAEPAEGAETNDLCAYFVRQHYSVESAAVTYQRLYADRTVTVDGFWKYYANPRALAWELFFRLPVSLRVARPATFLRFLMWPGSSRDD